MSWDLNKGYIPYIIIIIIIILKKFWNNIVASGGLSIAYRTNKKKLRIFIILIIALL